MMIFFWVAIAVGAILIFTYLNKSFDGANTRQTGGSDIAEHDPLEVLRDRYARGEIDTHEFEERKRILEND